VPFLLDCLLKYSRSTIISELLKYLRSVGDEIRLKQRKSDIGEPWFETNLSPIWVGNREAIKRGVVRTKITR
jgi:hypothetical protein